MLKNLKVKNLTVFSDAEFEFSPGLNVIVGENGTGKTHVLKSVYAGLYVSAKGGKDRADPTKAYMQPAVAEKFTSVFKPEQLGRLASRSHGHSRCEVRLDFADPGASYSFHFSTQSKAEVQIEQAPQDWLDKFPVYLPTRELLTIYPGFVPLYETTHLEFEETWRDTCILLGAPLAKGPREKTVKQLLAPLEQAMGGQLYLEDSRRFYLKSPSGNLEMHLVAEGHRKLATIARLIATGSLLDKGCLLWDEPEANLNPRLVKSIASTILQVCRNGIQVVFATHSLFLLRELEILKHSAEFNDVPVRFFGLHGDDKGVRVEQGDGMDDIGDFAALDEQLQQSDRYLESEA